MFRTVTNFYRLDIARTLVLALQVHDGSLLAASRWFVRTKTYRLKGTVSGLGSWVAHMLMVGMVLQIAAGVAMLVDWAETGAVGRWAFGLALLVSYPLTAAFALFAGLGVYRVCWYILHPKRLGKAVLARVLEDQVIKLRLKHHITVVAVAGSVGKTGTKLAIAQLLGDSLRVRYEAGNYNDRLTVPLIFFGQREPSIFNIFGWLRIIGENAASVEHPYPYDVVVVEIGTDGPGQMRQFAYLKPDITVLTAITPEHMEYFKTLDAVAAEETAVFDYSKRVLVNGDDTPNRYVLGRQCTAYGMRGDASYAYRATSRKSSLGGQTLLVKTPSGELESYVRYVGVQGATCALAATAVADMLGVPRRTIESSLARLEPFAGRMQVLDGIKHTKLIDDTYNASPVAVTAALDVLYSSRTKQRIAVLGSMNELGEYAREAHEEVGRYCDPRKLDLVVTLGRDAERWIAPTARKKGCVVHSFSSYTAAAAFVRKNVQEGAIVLAKGSQNGVFAEEVVKLLLAHPRDANKLVRQSAWWLRQKA